MAATGIAIFFIPMLHVLVMRASQALKRRREGIPVTADSAGNGQAVASAATEGAGTAR